MEWLDVQLVSQIATASTAIASTTYEDEWLDVCEVARTSGRAAHRVAGTVAALKHCSRMRLSQRLKIPKVAPHVLKRIDKHNRLASRGTDIIDISEKKAKKIKGSGAYKRLTSSAVLRVCFGVKCFTAPQSLSRKGKTPGPGSTNVTGATPLAASTRSTAEWFGASHLHCQKVRNAMACCVFQHQQQVAKPDSQVSEAIIKLAFDETELYSKISGSSERGFFHVLMLHASVVLVSPDGTRRFEFVLPPAGIQDTSSRVLNNAIMQRAGFLFTLPAGRVTLIQNSDKAKSCVRQASGPVRFGFVAAPDSTTSTHPPTYLPTTHNGDNVITCSQGSSLRCSVSVIGQAVYLFELHDAYVMDGTDGFMRTSPDHQPNVL